MPDEAGQPADLRDILRDGHNIHEALGITVEEASAERVVASMPVTWRVHQPFGLLHGGASAVLAESVASIGGNLAAQGRAVVGIELNASHLRAVSSGVVRATAVPVRIGRTLHVWDIDIRDDSDRPVCKARCTLAVLDRAK
jgi:1,4-dihydroxy-2-naphthoyl-CoA hydrolase